MDLELKSDAERRAQQASAYEAFSAVNLGHVRGEVAEALTAFGRLGLLEEYTKHDITHIDAMLEMYDWIIPETTRDHMTPADWLLIVMSTYLHDFGLLVTRAEFDAREGCDAYVTFAQKTLDTEDATAADYRAQILRMPEDERQRFLYQEFVRANHATRIRSWLRDTPDLTWGGDERITGRLKRLLGELEEIFLEDVGVVCESHHLNDINDVRKYPLSRPYGHTREEEANVQYAAFLLRTSDLLHVTKDRVPSMAASVVNPRNPKSQVEWAKQEAVRSVRPRPVVPSKDLKDVPVDVVEVHATFKEAEGYFGLTNYLQYASDQLSQTRAWSLESREKGAAYYEFPWRHIDMTYIEAKGFVAEPFEFSIDQAKILDLLTGHTLYNDTGVVLRELIQNSLDAVRLQAHIAGEAFRARIDIRWNSADSTLQVIDNGVGMTQSTIERNFLRVGASRYQEAEFRKQHPGFTSISRFGIGVLSAFMVADDVSVSTSHETEEKARHLSLRDVHGRYLVRLIEKQESEIPDAIREHGTSVTIRLRPSAVFEGIERIARNWVVVPECDLWLTVDEGPAQKIGFESVAEALTDALVDGGLARHEDDGLVGPYGQSIEVRTSHSMGMELAYAVVWSRWLEEWQFVTMDPDMYQRRESEAPRFGVSIGGIRVTSEPAGFRFGGIAAMANATGENAPRTNVARSAIERTEEYDVLLRQIYSGYASHVTGEMRVMAEKRLASLTRAAREASFLTQEIARWAPDSNDLLREVLRTVPAVVIEQGGKRKSLSLQELEDQERLASVESTTLSSLENVLWSMRGGSDPTLSKLLDAVGSQQGLPEDPVLCGLGGSGTFGHMFTSEWEVSRLELSDNSRRLDAIWRPRTSPSRWREPATFSELPSSLSRIAREAPYENTWGIELVRFADADDIEVVNLTHSLVTCQGQILVLPGSPFSEIEAVADDLPRAVRDWCVAYVLIATSAPSSRYGAGQFARRVPEGQIPSGEWVESVARHLDSAGIGSVLSMPSVVKAISAPDVDILDVLRWDTRSHGDR